MSTTVFKMFKMKKLSNQKNDFWKKIGPIPSTYSKQNKNHTNFDLEIFLLLRGALH